MVSYTVAQRTNESGVRSALGAQPGHILRIVFASILSSELAAIVARMALTRGLALRTE